MLAEFDAAEATFLADNSGRAGCSARSAQPGQMIVDATSGEDAPGSGVLIRDLLAKYVTDDDRPRAARVYP